MKSLQEKARKKGWIASDTPTINLKSDDDVCLRCGLIVDKPQKTSFFEKIKNFFGLKKNIPINFDWRDERVVSPVKDQGNCGSCASFAVCGGMESQLMIKDPKRTPDLSEAHLFFCSGNKCNTGSTFDSLLTYAKENGVTSECFFPYDNRTFNSCALKPGWESALTRISNFEKVAEKNLEEELIKSGPILAGMMVYSDFAYYKGGIYDPVSKTPVGGHGILIVGYGEEGTGFFGKKKYWIAKNSWGNWGEDGFFRIKKGVCKIGKMGLYKISVG